MVKLNALTALSAKRLNAGKYADGQGLWLWKRNKLQGKWILRLSIGGRRREMGLGRWPDVTLSEARQLASEARRQLRSGVDPIEARAKHRAKPEIGMTVATAIDQCFKARQAELKNDGKAGRWLSPLKVHIIPKIGSRAIEELDQHQLKAVFAPIWHTKPDAARKAMNRFNLTMKHAAALGLDVDLQAVMKAKALLGKQRHTETHIPSLPYQEAPSFYRMLMEKDVASTRALRFLMLTAARSSEVRLSTVEEIEGDLWIIPSERTKTGAEHRIPLSLEALSIIQPLTGSAPKGFLFSNNSKSPLSDAAMSKFMKDNGFDARPHGLRATFRSWAEECTDAAFETKEACLGHKVDRGTVAAYQRSDRLELRRELLQTWTNFLTG